MNNKKINKCEICGKIKAINRKPNHHIIPKKDGGKGLTKNRVWLCTECHVFLHMAEKKGLCLLPEKQSKSLLVGANSRTKLLMDKVKLNHKIKQVRKEE